MGCAASKAPPKRDPVEELIEEVHAQQGRESGGGATLDLSAAPAGADAPAEGRERAKIDAFAATTTGNGGWVRG